MPMRTCFMLLPHCREGTFLRKAGDQADQARSSYLPQPGCRGGPSTTPWHEHRTKCPSRFRFTWSRASDPVVMALDVLQYCNNIVRFTSECEDQYVDAPGTAALFLASGSDDVDNNGHVLERLQQEAALPLGQACPVPPGQVFVLSSTSWLPGLGGQEGGWRMTAKRLSPCWMRS